MIDHFHLDPAGVELVPPQGFLAFLQLEAEAALVLTDSGGVQEETCILKVPCVTLRENTERPETITVGANLLAGTVTDAAAVNQVYNVAVGDRTTLNDLYAHLHSALLPHYPQLEGAQPVHRDFRAGDVRHSLADIAKAQRLLGYAPTQRIGEGLALAMPWYMVQKI